MMLQNSRVLTHQEGAQEHVLHLIIENKKM